jgi:acetyl-CoA acetyltransferase
MARGLSGKAAIVGIGATDFSKDSGRSERRLAAEAVLDALDDAGLTPADVDGMVTFTMDSNTEIAVARATGIGELKFFSKIHHGGGAACATIQQAAIAVATGVADCVVAYRAFNERSGVRFGQVQTRPVDNADSTGVDNSFSYPHGLSTPAAQVAMIAKRYMHLSGATSKDFGAVSVADRKHAAYNPKAYFYEKPITIADRQRREDTERAAQDQEHRDIRAQPGQAGERHGQRYPQVVVVSGPRGQFDRCTPTEQTQQVARRQLRPIAQAHHHGPQQVPHRVIVGESINPRPRRTTPPRDRPCGPAVRPVRR